MHNKKTMLIAVKCGFCALKFLLYCLTAIFEKCRRHFNILFDLCLAQLHAMGVFCHEYVD